MIARRKGPGLGGVPNALDDSARSRRRVGCANSISLQIRASAKRSPRGLYTSVYAEGSARRRSTSLYESDEEGLGAGETPACSRTRRPRDVVCRFGSEPQAS